MSSSGRLLARSALICFGLLVAGCGRQSTAPPAQTESTPTPDDERIERLRSLGYLDTSGLPRQRAGRGVQVLDEKAAFSGYSLVVYAGTCTAELLTFRGEAVRSWTDQPCHRWEHAELLPNGDLVAVGARFDEDKVPDPIASGRYVLRLSWDGGVVWRAEINAHHDVSLTPDGKLLTLVLARRRIPEIDPENDVADDRITLLTQDGKVVESASLYDILSSSKIPFPFQKVGGKLHGSGRLIDLFHTNAARWTGPGSILLTVRHQDELMIVDWPTRQLAWHWGRGVLSGPHEGSVLPDGHMLVFDNGLSRGWSRVLEVDPRDTARLVQFAPGPSRMFSRVMGSCQRLPNGNTLVVNSEGGAAFELTPDGRPVWTFEGTQQTADGHRVKIIRMRKLAAATIDTILSSHRLANR
jgi:hypothetical protein